MDQQLHPSSRLARRGENQHKREQSIFANWLKYSEGYGASVPHPHATP
jgi:hypothetical protein